MPSLRSLQLEPLFYCDKDGDFVRPPKLVKSAFAANDIGYDVPGIVNDVVQGIGQFRFSAVDMPDAILVAIGDLNDTTFHVWNPEDIVQAFMDYAEELTLVFYQPESSVYQEGAELVRASFPELQFYSYAVFLIPINQKSSN